FLQQNLRSPVDAVGVLQCLADAVGDRETGDVKFRLGDRGLAAEDTGVVEVIVEAALDAGRIALHEDAMALTWLHIDPDVVKARRIEAEHRDVAEYDLAVRRRWANRGKSGATHRLRGRRHRLELRLWKLCALQPGRRRVQSGVERVNLGPGVEGDDI